MNNTPWTMKRWKVNCLYLMEGLPGLFALIADDTVLGIELPASVEMEVVECAPSIKASERDVAQQTRYPAYRPDRERAGISFARRAHQN